MTDQASSSTSLLNRMLLSEEALFQLKYQYSYGRTSKQGWRSSPCLMMLLDLKKFFIATGYTDLRRGIDDLASTIKFQFDLDPFQKHILFLFCGKRTDRIKGLVWEGDGFLLLYKRLNIGGFSWPRTLA